MPDSLHARPCSGPEPLQETELESRVKIEKRISPETREFYREALKTLLASNVPLLVGGAFAFEFYTGISRYTKDFDIFVKARDAGRVVEIFTSAGYTTEVTSPHWLAKVCAGDTFLDIIFGEANGVNAVNDEWFSEPVPQKVLDLDLYLCPPEEMICSKAFVMDRDRFDGADVAHLIRARAEKLDWDRMLHRFGDYWHVFLAHLLFFSFIYPSERNRIPDRVMKELLGRLDRESKDPVPPGKLCRGTLLSMTQYHIDLIRWGYKDAREFKGGI